MLGRFISKFMPTADERGAAESALIIAAAAVAVGLSLYVAPGLRGWLGAGLALLMLAIAVVDQRQFRIPDALVGAAATLGLWHAVVAEPQASVHALFDAALRGCVLGLLFLALRAAYARWRGREGMGLGDVKLAGAGGMWLAWPTLPVAIEIAALSALAAVAVGHLSGRRRIEATTRLPFGLFLAPAIWLAWLFEVWLAAA